MRRSISANLRNEPNVYDVTLAGDRGALTSAVVAHGNREVGEDYSPDPRVYDYLDVVLTDPDRTHAPGLVLRFRNPDVAYTLGTTLANAAHKLRANHPKPEDTGDPMDGYIEAAETEVMPFGVEL